MSKINNKLKSAGFKTWMDIDDICELIKLLANLNHHTLSDELKILNESQLSSNERVPQYLSTLYLAMYLAKNCHVQL